MSGDLRVLEIKDMSQLRANASLYLGRNATLEGNVQGFHILKFNREGDYLETYSIRPIHGNQKVCNCPAVVDNCRHKRMLSYMIRFGGLDNPHKVVVTDGKAMAWLKSPQPLINPDLLGDVQ